MEKKETVQTKEFWETRYKESRDYLFGKAPCSLLERYMKRLRKGKALDIAMGEGRNAVYMAQKGFEVTGFDISTTASDRASRLAKDTGVSVEIKTMDVDFFLMPMMEFDTIVMTYFKPITRYFSEIRRALVQGGTIAIEAFTTDQLYNRRGAKPEHAECFKPNELLRNLSDLRVFYYNETEVDGNCIVQAIAKKPTDRDAVKYGFAKGEQAQDRKTPQELAAEKLFKKG